MRRLLIDTDPGVDDAMAIIYAATHPGLDLVGLTTTFGNATIEKATVDRDGRVSFLDERLENTVETSLRLGGVVERAPKFNAERDAVADRLTYLA